MVEILTKFKMKLTMKARNFLSFLVAVFALAFLQVTPISAMDCSDTFDTFACIDDVTVNGISHFSDESAAVFAGDTIAVRVVFTANEMEEDGFDDDFEEDVRVIARILGEPGLSEVTERFDVIEGKTYSRLLNIKLPFDLDDNLNEPFILEVTVESNSEEADSVSIDLEVQRENQLIEILSVESDDEVKAGDNLELDVVIKNRGRDLSEDTFVRVNIPALGIKKMVFLGDLSPVDQSDPDKEDSGLVRVFLRIPKDTPAGVYNVEIEAFDDDSTTLATRKVVVVGAGQESDVISSTNSKTFAVGEEKEYTITIVNADDRIKVYELIPETTGTELSINLEESIVAVPAGSSKTVKMTVKASKEGTYNFAVNVHSDSELVKKQNFVANVEGRAAVGNAAVVLTIILAIIFVVLLIVLIVLLTRKSEKSEESFGESYY